MQILASPFWPDRPIVQQSASHDDKAHDKHDDGFGNQTQKSGYESGNAEINGVEFFSCSHESPFVSEK
jgi:hypothetical protein